jgi:DNA-binding GntR family transcriptional regulator
MTSPLRVERPQLLTDLAMDRIRSAIVVGELKLGEQMSEAQLALRMGISKTPVREALLRLKVDGLVDIHPQRGTFVFKLDHDQVGQLCRFRAMIEVAALREAATSQREMLLHEMALRLEQMAQAEHDGDVSRLSIVDMDFHRQFVVCCTNGYLRSAYDLIRYQLLALRHRSPVENCIDSHQVLYDAVAAKKIERACTLLQQHVDNTEEPYCKACEVD